MDGDMDRLKAIADKHKLTIIEDSAQALGGSFKGTKAGAFGDAGCFSFYPAKLLGAYGDAGAVTTNDKDIADKVRLYRHHGLTDDKDVAFWSFNCRMDNLQAALLDIKLKRLPEWIERRRAIALLYDGRLRELKQVHLPPPPADGDRYDVFQNYEMEVENRDGLRAYLTEQGIETLLPWGGRAVHQFKNLGITGVSLPRTERMMMDVIMIPMNPELEDEEVDVVADTIRRFYS